jgi:hypothetical protein
MGCIAVDAHGQRLEYHRERGRRHLFYSGLLQPSMRIPPTCPRSYHSNHRLEPSAMIRCGPLVLKYQQRSAYNHNVMRSSPDCASCSIQV